MTEATPTSVGEMRKSGLVKLDGEDVYSIWVKTACSNHNAPQLRRLADVCDRFARGYVLFSTRQIPIIPFVKLADIDAVREELARDELELDRCGPTVRNINVCYDDRICPDAVIDSISLAAKLDNYFHEESRHKIKIGVAGCAKDCVVTRVLSDFGFVAIERDGSVGYDCFIGGRLGVKPFLGVKIAEHLSEEQSERLVSRGFELMRAEGRIEERLADVIVRLGVNEVKRRLTSDLVSGEAVKPAGCPATNHDAVTGKMTIRASAVCGEVTSEQLRAIADIAENYGLGFAHFVVRGSPEIPGVDRRHLEVIAKELEAVDMPLLEDGLDNLQSCFGNYCTENNADPQSLLRRIDEEARKMDFSGPKVAISAAGCPNSCGVAQLNDIGFYGVVEPEIVTANCNGCGICVPVCKRHAITVNGGVATIDLDECRHCGPCIAICPFDAIRAKRRGFAVFVGGETGEDTRLGQQITEFVTEDEAFGMAERCLGTIQERAENAAAIIDQIGLSEFKSVLLAGEE